MARVGAVYGSHSSRSRILNVGCSLYTLLRNEVQGFPEILCQGGRLILEYSGANNCSLE